MGLINRLVSTPTWKVLAKYWFPFVTRRFADDMVFLNFGYEEDPPMALMLEPQDEPDRYCIQLYHRTAAQTELTGKRVLEVSCGHGGGASYLVRTMRPASYTGLDLNGTGVDFCRQRHVLPGLDFLQGNAQNLPFPDESFDAVLNIEASHQYPDIRQFFAEVARVLRPGGHFLYSDVRRCHQIADWEAALADAPLQMASKRDINDEVVRGLEKNAQRSEELWTRHTPALMHGAVRSALRMSNTKICDGLRNGESSYRMYCFVND